MPWFTLKVPSLVVGELYILTSEVQVFTCITSVEMRKPNRTQRLISDGDIISRKFASFQIILSKSANKRKGFFSFRHQSFKINEG